METYRTAGKKGRNTMNKNAHETFTNIQEALKYHNESGIVCYDDGNAIICNWTRFDGLPAISIFGVIGTGDEIEVIGRRKSDSWRRCIEGCNVIYDANNDMELADDGDAEIIELGNGVIVVAPLDWN